MWDCLACGVKRIAASILRCPTCREERSDMPKSTTGGASNAKALPGETGYVKPDMAEAAPAEPAVDAETPVPAKPAPAVTAPQPAVAKPAAATPEPPKPAATPVAVPAAPDPVKTQASPGKAAS